jgi:two-component system sensor histidine kinase YcbA
LLLQGLEEVVEQKLDDPRMDWSTIITLLQELVFQEDATRQQKITVDIIPGPNFFTHRHYYLLSVFRNLLVNAQEALQGLPYPGKIILEHEISGDYHLFRVKDSGRGIEPEDQAHIFAPGFSTKIDYTTGQIHRGLGLSLVKELVEKKLQGEISVISTPSIGTTFTLKIPKESLELNES